MLDVLGALYGSALCATVVGVLIGMSPMRPKTRLSALAAAAGWLVIVVAVAAVGGLAPGQLGPVPANLLPFLSLLGLLFGAWSFWPAFRKALLSIPLAVLVGLNAGRVGGVFFLLLHADGRLSAPFAPAAGYGDIITGAVAIPIAAMLALGIHVRSAWLRAWNAFGAADLAVAVTLGALSAPNTPFRLFTEGPGTQAMTNVPWVLVPAMLVPVFLLLHFVIAVRLSADVESARAALA